jgi:hypothetical protein
MEAAAMDIAHDFYEHKDEEKLLADGLRLNVSVKLTDVTETSKTYVVGDTWTIIIYRKPGKPVAVTLRPYAPATA